MKRFWMVVIAALATLTSHAAVPNVTVSPVTVIAATAIQADTFTLESKILQETRRINVFLPAEYAAKPDAQFAVLYMPDGGMKEDFPHVADVVDALSSWGGMRPVIVVGIENTQRRRDLTGPTEVSSDKKIATLVGGSAAFRAFIRDELKPAINARYRTASEIGIIGESLAGLFVVETCLIEPQLFDHYIALSPSLWCNNDGLVRSAADYLKEFKAEHKTLYIAAGHEGNIAPEVSALAKLVGNKGDKEKLSFEYHPMPEEFHDTIYRAAAPRALRKAFELPGAYQE